MENPGKTRHGDPPKPQKTNWAFGLKEKKKTKVEPRQRTGSAITDNQKGEI